MSLSQIGMEHRAPKIATVLLEDLAFFTNVRCKADVKLDSQVKVEMSRCVYIIHWNSCVSKRTHQLCCA